MSHPRTSPGLIAVVVVAAVLGFYLSLRFAGRNAEIQPPPSATAAVPAMRPVFALADTAGTTRSITEWDGRALIVNFWATWCPPCRREIPLLNQLQRERAADGFQVLGIAVDFRDSVLAYLKRTPVAYPVLIGEQEGLDAARAFGMATAGFPFTVFTDRGGHIVTVYMGELHRAEADVILGAIAQIDAGKLAPDVARTRIEQRLDELRRARRREG